ncbi:MAG: hypothetical protein D6706_20335 [Chloroflexi bacterium]|nr:MAG: hypothetical protein D6706_20335 [Chloroflexota bacterium]
MRRLSATFWHLVLVTLSGLPLTTPLWRLTAVPCTHDGHLHYHRVAAMRHAWQEGLYFTRWLPDLAFGYGYPFFIYREPAPLYAVLFPHMVGLPLSAASNLVYGLAILSCGWFMYLWVRDVLGNRAALVSAVAYMSAPYVLVDALVRGNLPESLALPLFPLLLWAGRRWVINGRFSPFLISSLGLIFLSLTHNISLLLFTPTLLLYLLLIGWIHHTAWRTLLGRLLLLFGLGLGTTIFYTGGALLEMNAVTLQQSTTTRNNDFHYNFASLDEIFAPPAPEDPTLINPPLPFRLGWGISVLAGLGVLLAVVARWQKQLKREQAWHVGMMITATAVFLLMSLPVTLPLWETLPLIDFTQFPWRFVGRAALPVAFLAGMPFACNWRKQASHQIRWSGITAVFAAAILLIEAIPGLYPAICPEEPFPTILTVHQYEHITGLVGVDPEGSYFPRTVQKRPQSSPLEADYQAGRPPQRFDITQLPATAKILAITYTPLSAEIRLTTPEPFMARYLSFAFAGWAVEIDGRSIPITPEDPTGLITFPVPAGEHSIKVRWAITPLRAILSALSLMSLGGWLVTAVLLHTRQNSYHTPHTPPTPNHTVSRSELLWLLVSLVILGLKMGLIDRTDTPLRHPTEPPVAETAVLQAGELQLVGYTLSRNHVPSGNTFDIHLAWRTLAPPQADYQSNVWLRGPDGLIWSNLDTQRPRLYEDAPPSRFWQPGQWAWDSREVQVLSGTPPGTYDLVLTLFDRNTLHPLTLIGANGEVWGPTAVIGQVEVTMPDTPPQFTPDHPLTQIIPDTGLILLGFNQDRTEATVGDPFALTLFWERAAGKTAVPTQIDLQLFTTANELQHTWTLPLTRADFPHENWPAGSRLRGQYLVRLPASLKSGNYLLGVNNIPLGTITIHAPERQFTQPPIETAVHTTFSQNQTPFATLIGYTITQANNQLTLTLVWQAKTETNTSYRVFVHLIDNNGQILTQSDGEPANWTRPTTSWITGEYITDTHTLTLPPSPPNTPLQLRIGLYEPETNTRLQTETADFLLIPLPPN